jgi:hypothetical protein
MNEKPPKEDTRDSRTLGDAYNTFRNLFYMGPEIAKGFLHPWIFLGKKIVNRVLGYEKFSVTRKPQPEWVRTFFEPIEVCEWTVADGKAVTVNAAGARLELPCRNSVSFRPNSALFYKDRWITLVEQEESYELLSQHYPFLHIKAVNAAGELVWDFSRADDFSATDTWSRLAFDPEMGPIAVSREGYVYRFDRFFPTPQVTRMFRWGD